MAKNPNPAGNAGKETVAAVADDKLATAEAANDKVSTHTTAQSAGVDDSGSNLEAYTAANASLKLDVKTASTEATASASLTSGSQAKTGANSISSKQRRLNTPSPNPLLSEEDIVDLKCLLLADTSVHCAPLHLRQLLQHVEGNTATTAPEILLLLIYCIALETGFITRSEFTQHAEIIIPLAPTSSFHSKNVLRMSRYQPTYTANDTKQQFVMQLRNIVSFATVGGQSELLDSQVTCLVTGDFVIVTHTPNRMMNVPGRSVCLSIGRYVLNAHPKVKQLFQCFRKLDELSRVLRESVFVPVRNCQLEGLTINVFPALLGLPDELYDNIFKYLSQNQLKILANVNKQLNYSSTRSKYYL